MSEGRLDGRYKVKSITLHSTFRGSDKQSPSRWVFSPKCKALQRPCATKMHSNTGDYSLTFAYIHGRYRGVVTRHYTDSSCGKATEKTEFTIIPSKAKFLGEEWVVTAFKGTFEDRATAPLCLPAEDRAAVKGVKG